MKWNQAKKEGNVKSGNLIVGIDIAKRLHYAVNSFHGRSGVGALPVFQYPGKDLFHSFNGSGKPAKMPAEKA